MNTTATLARLARRARDIIAECNYAQRRLTTLQTTVDSYLPCPDQAPGSYPESSGIPACPGVSPPPSAARTVSPSAGDNPGETTR
jgi:hypothetical protein